MNELFELAASKQTQNTEKISSESANENSDQKLNTDSSQASSRLSLEHLDLSKEKYVGLLAMQELPENNLLRYSMVTQKAAEDVPKGVWDAAKHNFQHFDETIKNLGSAAAMAVVLKTALPESGWSGKIAGGLIGSYFTYKATEPAVEAYKKVAQAQTAQELDKLSSQIGDAGGSILFNSAVGLIGYRAGSHLTERALTSKYMDGFADSKAKFYNKAGELGSRLTDAAGISTTTESSPRARAGGKDSRIGIPGSDKRVADGTLKGDLDPNLDIEITVMLKSKASELKTDRTLSRILEGRQEPLTDADFEKSFGAKKSSLAAVDQFAKSHDLKMIDSDLRSGRVVLSASVAQFAKAFDTDFAQYESPTLGQYRDHVGQVTIPRSLAKHIDGIYGIDNRPQANTRSIMRLLGPQEEANNPKGLFSPKGYLATEVADAYNFPKESMGKGQGVGIIELDGGLDLADNAKFYANHSLPQPNINVIEIGKGKNKTVVGSREDTEVALDSQILGVVAPEATQNLIFAKNDNKGFIDAVTRATFPKEGEVPNSVISISWGRAENSWDNQGLSGLSQALKKAAIKGITVFAASGDDGAKDGSFGGTLQADYPASDPTVTGTGGTTLMLKNGKIESEVSWQKPNGTSGGGISQIFAAQDFQKNANVPPHAVTKAVGRGVPDVAGNADMDTGYQGRLDGQDRIFGGTSAVSPLYAGLVLRINGILGKPVGSLNQWLSKNTDIFNDITVGENGGYKAGPGWDAVTGWGSIDGTKMLNALRKNPNVSSSFGNFRFLGPSQLWSSPIPQDSGQN